MPPRRTRESLVSTLREGFQYELFRDLHDHLYDRFQRPSVVFVVSKGGKLKTCFPRRRVPLPSELFHHLTAATSTSRDQAVIEKFKLTRANELLSKDRDSPSWGWHSDPLGLIDLYLPIRIPSGRHDPVPSKIIGVLVIGRFKDSPNNDDATLHQWIDRISNATHDPRPKKSPLPAYADFLHSLANEIPALPQELGQKIQYEATRSLALLERFLTRMISAETIFGEEGLIAHLGLTEPGPSITLTEAWDQLGRALRRITAFLSIPTAALFSAGDRDYSDLELRVRVPEDRDISPRIRLATLAEFTWLQGENWVNLPRSGDYLSWLNPLTLVGAENAILFGRATVGGHLIVLAFGFNSEKRLTPSQRTALYDAVTSRVFPFLHSAFSAIELDDLMAETGHLLGRAVGKVTAGYSAVRQLLPTTPPVPQEHLEEYSTAQWAIDDGIERLNLIRLNFYSFAANRRTVEMNEESENHEGKDHREPVDLVEIINGMRAFFGRSVNERMVRYNLNSDQLISLGNRDAFRMTLLNLFDNALKFSYSNTFLMISAFSQDQLGVVEMENLGIGVARDEWRHVFRRLARSRFRDPHRRIEGLGLGLSYCRRVIEEIFRGKITLRSREAPTPHRRRFEGDNWLTTVRIEVPLANN